MPTPYKQTDIRWRNEKLGNSSTTIGQGGCTISCIGYLHNLITGENITPSEVNKRMKATGAFQGSLVLWSRVPRAFPELVWKFRDYNYNNAMVWSWINIWPRVPVLVENRMASISGRHWRLFIGGGRCYNPLSGAVESTTLPAYKMLSGSARYARK